MKETAGVPSQRIQRGIRHCRPTLLVHSVAAPIGQKIPHHERPVKITERKTSGNQTPHSSQLANVV